MAWAYFIFTALALWTVIGASWWLLAWAGSRHGRAASTSGTSFLPASGVTIFKPVAAGESTAALSGALQSFLAQLGPHDEMLLGVVESDRALWETWAEQQAHSGLRVISVPAPPPGRVNRKMATLRHMAPHACHRIWFWSDADILLPADGWTRIKSEYHAAAAEDGAALTCSYRIHQSGGACGMLEALYVNAELQPGVRTAERLGRGRVFFALGAGTMFDSSKLDDATMARMVPMLADDYQLGLRLGRSALSSVILETPSAEHDWAGAVLHYMRWHKTVRWSQPGGYAGQIVLLPLLGWSIAAIAAPSVWTLGGGAVVWLLDSAVGGILARRAGLRPPLRSWLVLPLWALLRAWIWVLVWLPWPVVWRGIFWWRPGPSRR